ncbi:MAG: XdhC family protein [Oceanicoccus sp.]
MDDMHLAVISQLNQWLDNREDCWLCTVLNTWGSAPRLPGSLMVCNRQGSVIGSLSGGCVEDDLVLLLQQGELAASEVTYKIYGETDEDIERFQLPCGGTLGILIEPFSRSNISDNVIQQFQTIERRLQQRTCVQRQCDYTENKQAVQPSDHYPSISHSFDTEGRIAHVEHILGPSTHLMIIGICEVARYLAQFALATGYRVSICDPRPEMAEEWNVDHTTLFTAMPDDTIRAYSADSNSAIVAVSHDPRIDDMGLMDAFNSNAFYIGAMGSKRTSEKRRERLQQLGISLEDLSRLKAPIGLDIHSKTPAEIAISILAEVISTVGRNRSHA